MSNILTNSASSLNQHQEEEDEDLVILPDVDNSELIAQFKLSLVGRLFNRDRRSVEALISLLPRPSIWDVEGRVRGLDLGNHRFQFDFECEADLLKVLNKRPCHFNKWSFSLERWTPHIGDTFPNTMAFWICAIGIPTHFWLDPIFKALGDRLGTVGPIEAKSAKFQVEINVDLPLKFALRARLPSGETVPVKLEYVNLHRWCLHCRHISHEADSCPELSENQRRDFKLAREADRDQENLSRKDFTRNGEPVRRLPSAETKSGMMQDRRPTAETHRDTRDSVWKRIDSRFNSRDEHRSDARPEHYPRGRERKVQNKESGDKQHQDKGVYNKRRYEESFSQSKKKENERRVGDGENLNRINAGADRAAGTSRVPSPLPLPDVSADSQRTISDHNMKPVNYRSSSPEHRRERPFMLSLSKRLTAEEKLKGKLPESGDTSDAASSAKKSLFLNSNQNLPAPVLPRATPLEPATNQKPMSWYEMTMEDEEEAIEAQLGQENQTLPKENLVNPELEMDAEKILEAEDWMDEEGAYDVDNDDLLDEEDLQEEDLGIPIPSPFGASESGVIPVREDVPCQMETSPPKKLASTGTSPLHRAGTPKRVSPSTSKKKKNSPSPLVAGLSLKKRNMMLGMGSPKEKTKKNGPTPAQEKDQNLPISKTVSPSYTGQKKAKELNAKSSKVGSSKPPKIPK